jgi:hypothetical protein
MLTWVEDTDTDIRKLLSEGTKARCIRIIKNGHLSVKEVKVFWGYRKAKEYVSTHTGLNKSTSHQPFLDVHGPMYF